MSDGNLMDTTNNVKPVRLPSLDTHKEKPTGPVTFIGASKRFAFTDEIREKISRNRKGIPVSEERKAHLSAINKGKKHSPETIEKMSRTRKGHKVSAETRAKLSARNKGRGKHNTYNVGRKHPPEFGRKLSAIMKGRPNPKNRGPLSAAWKGGRTTLRNHVENSLPYKKWREDVFVRDNYTCWDCGERGGALNAHHVRHPFASILDEHMVTTFEQAEACYALWDISNGVTLCTACHSVRHGRPSVMEVA
jgi:hypothetical protein